MTIDHAFLDVRNFHLVMDQPAPDRPTMQTPELIERRMKWIDSEQQELRDAKTVEDQADAYIDIAYFAVGGLVELGVLPGELWYLAHGANMRKLWPDGKPRKMPDGKIIKPEGWVDPTPAQKIEILRQMNMLPLLKAA